MRFPVRDMEFEGLAIARNTPLYVLLGAACHDPDEFPDPFRFDIDRPNNKDHMGFGAGQHTCIGNVIVRAVLPPLIADIVRPPKKAIKVMARAIPKAASGPNGVAHQSPIPTRLAASIAPRNPSSVLFGLTLGAIGR